MFDFQNLNSKNLTFFLFFFNFDWFKLNYKKLSHPCPYQCQKGQVPFFCCGIGDIKTEYKINFISHLYYIFLLIYCCIIAKHRFTLVRERERSVVKKREKKGYKIINTENRKYTLVLIIFLCIFSSVCFYFFIFFLLREI